jgi:hypothetical protein
LGDGKDWDGILSFFRYLDENLMMNVNEIVSTAGPDGPPRARGDDDIVSLFLTTFVGFEVCYYYLVDLLGDDSPH